jgi:predicted TIM-barrel fold metal-dependent hydrolase
VSPPHPPFVDVHHHLWDLERNPYPWLTIEPPPEMVSGDIRPLRHSYRLGDYLADAREQNVIRSVHIEAGWDPKQPVMETEWLQGLADEHGYPLASTQIVLEHTGMPAERCRQGMEVGGRA